MLNIKDNNRKEVESLITKLTITDWNTFDIVFLLGAGCSRSSGIPGAQELASRWFRELSSEAKEQFSGIDKSNMGEHYFDIFFARFPRSEYKDAIAHFIKAGYPGLGYTIFANLLASSDKLANCKTILTTNFDNLIEQAFILFTSERPIVIPEPSLIGFLKDVDGISVVKIHGDSRYDPKNNKIAVDKIPTAVEKGISNRINKGILIVLGYAGVDNGVADLILKLIKDEKIKQIWWVDTKPPGRAIQEKLPDNFDEFFLVHHADFDDFMLKLKHRIDVPHFSATRMDEHIYKFHDRLMWRLGLYGNDGQPKIIIDDSQFTKKDYFRLFAQAGSALEKSERDKALEILEDGLIDHSQSANYNILLGAFHKTIMGDKLKAIKLFRDAKNLAPDHSRASAELANILKEHYGAIDKTSAEYIEQIINEFVEAEKLDPLNISNTLNYAGFLLALDEEKHNSSAIEKLTFCSEKLYEPLDRMELAFYVFAHNLKQLDIGKHLEELRDYLERNFRSPDFDLSWNVKKAERDGHPHIALVQKLAQAINSDLSEEEAVKLKGAINAVLEGLKIVL